MKGIVFTEFLVLVEQEFGMEILDNIIIKSKLPSQGAYTTIGTYDFLEMQNLLGNLSNETGISTNELLYLYGKFFFNMITSYHKDILNMYNSPLEMLASIESHIHVQVKKIHIDAELPTFRVIEHSKHYLEMMYYSERSMYMFAKGLIEKTFEYFNANSVIEMEMIKENGSQVKFKIYEISNGGK